MSALPFPVENRVFLKAMRQCLTDYRKSATDLSLLAQLMALHRAGYPAQAIETNFEKLMSETSTTS